MWGRLGLGLTPPPRPAAAGAPVDPGVPGAPTLSRAALLAIFDTLTAKLSSAAALED